MEDHPLHLQYQSDPRCRLSSTGRCGSLVDGAVPGLSSQCRPRKQEAAPNTPRSLLLRQSQKALPPTNLSDHARAHPHCSSSPQFIWVPRLSGGTHNRSRTFPMYEKTHLEQWSEITARALRLRPRRQNRVGRPMMDTVLFTNHGILCSRLPVLLRRSCFRF